MTAPVDIHRFIHDVSAQVRDASEVAKILKHFVRAAAERFEAESACAAVFEPGMETALALFSHPPGMVSDLTLISELLRGERRQIPTGTVAARLTRRNRSWGMLVLQRSQGPFAEGTPRELGHIAEAASDLIQRLDQRRLAEVRARIDDKLMSELPAKDLYYQILDGLQLLTRYDHSAALWIWNPATETLDLVAEQISWRKSKSDRIGQSHALSREQGAALAGELVAGFDRSPEGWVEWTEANAASLAQLLDPGSSPARPPAGSLLDPNTELRRPAAGSLLLGPLSSRRGPLGVLAIAEQHPGAFREYERGVVERLALQASLALQRAESLENLQARMLKVERQGALAQLAGGVAHDINNALGEVIPLVQQVRADLAEGRLDTGLLAEDLDRVDQSLQVVRDIFGRMMRFARGTTRAPSAGNFRKALNGAQAVLHDGLGRRSVSLALRVADELPELRCGTSDLERLLLNLMTNARDAMPSGGTLTVAASLEGEVVEVLVADTGVGMDRALLQAIERPFHTTKEDGTGLGLSTCRSIVSEAGGTLEIESEPGRGTRVKLRLPVAVEGAVVSSGAAETAGPIPS
jgi:two-component system, NtrC family, sensor kinase